MLEIGKAHQGSPSLPYQCVRARAAVNCRRYIRLLVGLIVLRAYVRYTCAQYADVRTSMIDDEGEELQINAPSAHAQYIVLLKQ